MPPLTIAKPGGPIARVYAAIDGFHRSFGCWPDIIEAHPETIAGVEDVLTPLGLERLRSKIGWSPCRELHVVALGNDNTLRFDYDQVDRTHSTSTDQAREWLGLGQWEDQFAEQPLPELDDDQGGSAGVDPRGPAVQNDGGILVRVLHAIDAFRARYGRWPDAFASNQETFDALLKHHLTKVGAKRFRQKLKLIESATYKLEARGLDGLVFDYVTDAWTEEPPAVARQWLGLQEANPESVVPTEPEPADAKHVQSSSQKQAAAQSIPQPVQPTALGKKMSSTAPEVSSQIVYVLTNPSMPGLVKIGKTTQMEVEMRMKQLYGTGVPVPFDCAFACQVKDAAEVEKVLHFAFDNDRINPNREFFQIEPERVVAILKLLEVKDITGQFEQQIEADVTTADRQSAQKMKDRRPRMNFIDLGIPVGSILVSKDGQAQATVMSDRTVSFQGTEQSLTAVTRKVLGLDPNAPIQPSPYWTFNGKSVKKIYDEYHAGDAD